MLTPILLLWFWFEQWRADRALEAHKRNVVDAQLRATERAIQFQQQMYEQQRP